MIKFTHPAGLISWDETGIVLSQEDDTQKSVGHADLKMSRRSATHKGTERVTGIGGSRLDGVSMLPGFICRGESYDERWVCRATGDNEEDVLEWFLPQSTITNSAGTPLRARVICTPTPHAQTTHAVD